MVGVWDVCPCMDNVFRDMQIGDCPTGVLVSYVRAALSAALLRVFPL